MLNSNRPTRKPLARLLGALIAAPLLAGAAVASAAPAVYGESAMVKVRPADPPHADSGIGLSAARNEFVSFQVVVNGADSGAAHVRAALGSLAGPSSIGGSDVSLYRETYLTTSNSSAPNAPTGAWPDGLQPDVDEIAGETRSAFPFDVPAGESRVIWVDVHVPADATPGSYTGAVQVEGDGLSASVPVNLTVVDASLPSTASLKTAFLVSSMQVCQAHTGSSDCGGDNEKMFGLLGKYEQMALEHRITLTNIVPKVPADGNWQNIDRWDGPYLDGTAPNRLAGAKMTSVQYLGPYDAASYAAFAAHFKQKGWFDRAFDYSADEPPYGSSFSDAVARAQLAKQGDPNFRTLVTTTIDQADQNGLTQDLDIITPVVNYMDGDAAPYQGDQSAKYAGFKQVPGHELWEYQSCMSHGCAYGTNQNGDAAQRWPSYSVDASPAQNRAMEWVSYLEGATGELYYETALALPNAWNDQYQFGGNGDGTLFYPGTTNVIGGQTDVPVASIRLALIRLGEQDYEWLKLVSDAGDPAFARQVARALVPSAYQVPDDGAAFQRARLQLISRYLQLTGKSAPSDAPGSPPAEPSSSPADSVQNGGDPDTGAAMASGEGQSEGQGCETGGAALSLLAGLFGLGRLVIRRRR